jgi:type I restriction enzyme S subunit
VKLKDIAKLEWGNTSITKSSYVEVGFPAFSAAGSDGFLSHAEFEEDGIVLSAIGARCGKCFKAHGKWTAIKNTIIIIPNKEKVDLNYLFIQLNDEKSWKISGAAQPFITLATVRDRLIQLPPIAEQQRIAALLDTADRILKLRESAIAKLDQLAQSVFSQIFLDAKHSIAIKKLGEICDVRDGTHDSPKYVNKKGIPLITSKNLTRGFIDLSDVNLISSNDFFEINKRSKVDCGDILMPMIGTIGNPVIVKDQNPNFAIKNVALIKQTPNSPNSIYLKAVLEGASFKSYVEKISRGGTQKFLGLGDIRKFKISIVNKKIEEEFVNFINKLNILRDQYVINALKQKEMLASLQHQSFAVN